MEVQTIKTVKNFSKNNILHINIADIRIKIQFDNPHTIKTYRSFKTGWKTKPDLFLKIRGRDIINSPAGKLIVKDSIIWVRAPGTKNGFYVYFKRTDSNEIIYMLKVNERWNDAEIFYSIIIPEYKIYFPGPPDEILFRNKILFHNGIVLHASAIKFGNKGIIFSAPSGTGKSTMAHLWEKHMGAKILNEDRPALRIAGDFTYVYGTPWSGSVPIHINDSAPLSAIVMLEQAAENKIQRIYGSEVISLLMPRCFLPYHDEELMKMAISNLEQIISNVPVYLLQCRPDQEAVELVYKCIK